MTQYPMTQTKLGKGIFAAFLFAMLLLARDTLVTSCLLGFNRSQFLMLGLICAYGLAFLVLNRKQWKPILTDRRVGFAMACAFILLLPMLIKRDWQMMYFSVLICLLFAIFLSYFTDIRETGKYYVLILSFLCLHSLLTQYVLKGFAISGALKVPVFYNSAEWEFYNFGLSFVVTSRFWHRNFGIFREPGVYQFFLLLGLFLNNYRVDWKKSWQMWMVNGIFVATMLSTYAVGGIIELALFALFLYFDKKWYRTKAGLALGLTGTAAVVGAVTFIVIQIRKPGFEATPYYNFYDMYLRLTTSSDSLVDRFSAIFTNMGLFFRSPLVGDRIAAALHGTNHNTSSTMILYAIFGIVGGSLNVAAWVALVWEKKRNFLMNGILLVILFMSFNTQNLVADIFFWLFPMLALTERVLPNLSFGRKEVTQ